MIRRTFLACLLVLALPAQAQSVKLTAPEIYALLSGNMYVGKWVCPASRQFFGVDVTIIYAQEGARSTRGQWRIDAAKDEYQSIWPRDSDWEGWFVMEWDGTFYWVSKKTPPTPFKLLEGEQLVSP